MHTSCASGAKASSAVCIKGSECAAYPMYVMHVQSSNLFAEGYAVRIEKSTCSVAHVSAQALLMMQSGLHVQRSRPFSTHLSEPPLEPVPIVGGHILLPTCTGAGEEYDWVVFVLAITNFVR